MEQIEFEQLKTVEGKEKIPATKKNFELAFGQLEKNEIDAIIEVPCEEEPEDDNRHKDDWVWILMRTCKWISCFLLFGMVAMAGIVTKATTLVLANSAGKCAKYENGSVVGCYESTTNDVDIININTLRVQSYLILMYILLFPDVLSILYSVYRILLKGEKTVDWSLAFKVLVPDLLADFAEAILFLRVLPNIDATVACIMMTLGALIPFILSIHGSTKFLHGSGVRMEQPEINEKRYRLILLYVFLIIEVVGFAGIGMITSNPDYGEVYSTGFAITTLSCLIFCSCRYWENFVSDKFFGIKLQEVQREMDKVRFKTSILFSIVRAAIIVLMTFIIMLIWEKDSYLKLNDYEATAEYDYSTIASWVTADSLNPEIEHSLYLVMVTNFGCSLGMFYFGRIACQTRMQKQSYTIPAVLVTPVMTTLCATLASLKAEDPTMSLLKFFKLNDRYEYMDNLFFEMIDWKCDITSYAAVHNPAIYFAILGVLGFLCCCSMYYVNVEGLWKYQSDKMDKTEIIFLKPIYAGPTIPESQLLNKRRVVDKMLRKGHSKNKSKNTSRKSRKSSKYRRLTQSNNKRSSPYVFLCATMWHETEGEMTQLLTSIMRLDRDNSERKQKGNKSNYYDFQVHIMFDDAMEDAIGEDEQKIKRTNKFVKELMRIIPKAAEAVAEDLDRDTVKPPMIYATPYGGRLDYVLPHGNVMHIHLKDKDKIRHKKRWSQCMYMYYINCFLPSVEPKYGQDTFILALDGDVDFQPRSLTLMLDRMKRNEDVGAVCGRIHPVGSGPVVWFQKFEYAVGHWLQKTTEHVLGCVLCSPGCFSLFRIDALLDTNVMRTYTTVPKGEDRWLCTLMLKAGWKIEYCAASDSYTNAPDEFKEFYNQRRRWGPSTMANIFDVLLDSRRTVKNNRYISRGYIAYQIALMISTLLGPACVVMIVTGAFAYVFSWNATVALIVSLTPVVIYIIVCYTCSTNIQIWLAEILTLIYTLVMMAVLVGIIGEISTTVFLNPNSLFMMSLVGIYAFTGIIHPTEMWNLVHGVIYYLCIPSAFILLQIYSFCNMNDVSWGTREVTKLATAASNEQALKVISEKKSNKTVSLLPTTVHDSHHGLNGYSCGCGGLCQCAFCITVAPESYSLPHTTRGTILQQPVRGMTDANDQKRTRRMTLNYLKHRSKITGIENPIDPEEALRMQESTVSVRQLHQEYERKKSINVRNIRKLSMKNRANNSQLLDSSDSEEDEENSIIHESENECYWILDDDALIDGVFVPLDKKEKEFWKILIKKFLQPLKENKQEQDKVKEELKDLRDKMTGAYFLINGLWITLTYALTLAISDINVTFVVQGEELIFNPLSFVFLIFFFVVLVIQFFSMMVHRWSTFVHLLSDTKFFETNEKNTNENQKSEASKLPDSEQESPTNPHNSNIVYGERAPNGALRNLAYEPSDNESITTPSLSDRKNSTAAIKRRMPHQEVTFEDTNEESDPL